MQQGTTIHIFTDQVVVESCITCGMTFGMPDSFRKMRLRDGRGFYCPVGHKQWFTRRQDEEARLKQEAEAARAKAQHEADQRQAAERALAAQKGVNTKLKKRMANGVCPCCGRTSQNLQDHIAKEHPDFKAEHTPERVLP